MQIYQLSTKSLWKFWRREKTHLIASIDNVQVTSPVWFTKGVAFWGLLSSILLKVKPDSLLEFGSGRSTTFLAEYANAHGKLLISIEQSQLWHQKVSADLAFMDINQDYVKHVPLAPEDDGEIWYARDQFKKLVAAHRFDFVLVDGPEGDKRKSRMGQSLIADACCEAKIILVDDVHRDHNLDFFLTLISQRPEWTTFYYSYGPNELAIGADGSIADIINGTFDFLNLEHRRQIAEV